MIIPVARRPRRSHRLAEAARYCGVRGQRGPLRALCVLLVSLCVFAFAAVSWFGGSERSATARRATPDYIPVVAFPVAAGRGALLLAAVRTLTVPVHSLLICDNSGGAPDVACALEELRGFVAGGSVAATNLTIVARPEGTDPDALLGVSECWNLLAEHAFGEQGAPWVLISNDDVGYPPPAALAGVVREVWLSHATHAFLLAESGLPGNGNAFSALVLTRAGWGALGRFDENFFPAYYEDCDYLYRAKLLGVRWRAIPSLHIQHPIAPLSSLPALYTACLIRRGAAPTDGTQPASFASAFISEARARVQDGPLDAPQGNRVYYQRKWGGPLGACGVGEFESPFNDATLPLSAWEFDAPRRDAILRGEL